MSSSGRSLHASGPTPMQHITIYPSDMRYIVGCSAIITQYSRVLAASVKMPSATHRQWARRWWRAGMKFAGFELLMSSLLPVCFLLLLLFLRLLFTAARTQSRRRRLRHLQHISTYNICNVLRTSCCSPRPFLLRRFAVSHRWTLHLPLRVQMHHVRTEHTRVSVHCSRSFA